jgi:putative holliday junction resolvase
MKILGIDFGTKRIGIALSDGLLITAQGQESIMSKSLADDIAKINQLVAENGVTEIVVGLPISMNGTYSQKTKETLVFVENLSKAVSVPVKTWDERLTSLQAERVLLEADMSRQKRKILSDKIAAQLILQSYLDCRKKGQG